MLGSIEQASLYGLCASVGPRVNMIIDALLGHISMAGAKYLGPPWGTESIYTIATTLLCVQEYACDAV